jgi:hypothetical protein
MGVVRGSIPRESISFCRPLFAAIHGAVGWVEFFLVVRPADWCCGGPCARFVPCRLGSRERVVWGPRAWRVGLGVWVGVKLGE